LCIPLRIGNGSAMTNYRVSEIVEDASELLDRVWSARKQVWGRDDVGLQQFLLEAPQAIISHCFGMKLVPFQSDPAFPRMAGYVDFSAQTIGVRRDMRKEIQRFTLGHEIGHGRYHSKLQLCFRDLPLTGGELASKDRPETEIVADRFSAELLMPRGHVLDFIRIAWGTERLERDQLLAGALTAGCARLVTKAEIQGSLERCLLLVASCEGSPRSGPKPSIAQWFGVSPTAMAIQLKELGVVR